MTTHVISRLSSVKSSYYNSGYSVGFEAGIRAEAAKRQQRSAPASYNQGFAAGQRAEQDRVRIYLDVSSRNGDHIAVPGQLPESTPQRPQPPHQSELASSVSGPTLPGAPQWDGRPSRRDTLSVPLMSAQELAREDNSSSRMDSSYGASDRTKPTSQSGLAPEAPLPIWHQANPRKEGGSRYAIVTCVFCGREILANALPRHKKRRHPAELAAAGGQDAEC